MKELKHLHSEEQMPLSLIFNTSTVTSVRSHWDENCPSAVGQLKACVVSKSYSSPILRISVSFKWFIGIMLAFYTGVDLTLD